MGKENQNKNNELRFEFEILSESRSIRASPEPARDRLTSSSLLGSLLLEISRSLSTRPPRSITADRAIDSRVDS